jgi:hypothetical protein
MRHNLSHGLQELSAEQGQDRNGVVNQDAENVIPVPTQMARLGAVCRSDCSALDPDSFE